jgi:hypothetical protein
MYKKDFEPDGMCLDAIMRHIVLQCARVIGTFGAEKPTLLSA